MRATNPMLHLDLLGVPKDMQQVTLLDGGMGKELFLRSNKPASPLFSAQAMLDDPEMVIQLHCDFISADADLTCINSYAATPERLARDADISVFAKIQKAAVRAALIDIASPVQPATTSITAIRDTALHFSP